MKVLLALFASFALTKAASSELPVPTLPTITLPSDKETGIGALCSRLQLPAEKITALSECLKKAAPQMKIAEAEQCFKGDGPIGNRVLEGCKNPDDKETIKCVEKFVPNPAQFLLQIGALEGNPIQSCAKHLQ